MPEENKTQPDYVSTVYNNLKQAYGDQFQKTEDEFRSKMSTDFNYRKTVHDNLKNAYGDNFKKDFTTFNYQLPSISNSESTLPGTTVEDFDQAAKELPKLVGGMKSAGPGSVNPEDNTSMRSETTNNLGGAYKTLKAQADVLKSWEEKRNEQTTTERLAKKDPNVLKSDIQLVSKAAATLFSGKKALGKDSEEYSKYLLHLKDENPEKFEEQLEKLGKYGSTISDKERYNMIQEGINYNAKKLANDQEILTSRGDALRFKEFSNIAKQYDQLDREIKSYNDKGNIPAEKQEEIKSRLDALNQKRSDFDSDEKNTAAVDAFGKIYDEYDSMLKAENKLILDTPSILKEKKEAENIKRQEALIEGDFKNLSAKDIASGNFQNASTYQGKEILGNVWNTVLDNATGLMETMKDVADREDGYSFADRFVDKAKDLVDSHLKATVSETDMFNENGDIKWYRFGPNLAKVATDMAITLAPVGRLTKLGEAAKLGKYADEVAAVGAQYLTTYDDYKRDAIANGMSSDDAEVYGAITGLATSMAAAISPNEAILNPTAKKNLSALAKKYAEQGVTGITKKEGFQKLVSEVSDLVGVSMKEGAKESLQENMESVAEKLVNMGFNARDKANGVKLSEDLTREEVKANTIMALALTAPVTGGVQLANRNKILDGAAYDLVKNYDETMKLMADMKENGRLSEDAFNRVTSQIENTKEIYDKIPENFSDGTKQNLMPLIREKVNLEDKIKRLDKAFTVREAKKLEDINKQLEAFTEKENGQEIKADTEEEVKKQEGETEIKPLTDDEVKKLTLKSDVFIEENGKAVPAKIELFYDNGDVMVRSGDNIKITRANNLVKEVPVETKIDGDQLDLSDDELNELKGMDEPESQSGQDKSKQDKMSDAWALAVKNRLEKVFKGVEAINDTEEFSKIAASSTHPNASEANGLYDRATNKIYLNPAKAKKDTPIHEFGHIWSDVLEAHNPDLFTKLTELSKESDFYKAAQENTNYKHLSDKDLAVEAFVQALGEKGVEEFNDMSTRSAFSQGVKDMWDFVKVKFGIDKLKIDGNTTFGKFVDTAAKDLVKSKPAVEVSKKGAESMQIFNEPVEEISKVAEEYAKSRGIKDYKKPGKISKLKEDNSKKIADAFQDMKHDPGSEAVKKAYKQMADETIDQGKFIIDNGYKIEVYEGKGEPYKNSEEMLKDLRDNKHMFVLSTEKDFGNNPITEGQRNENPLLSESGINDVNGKPLLINDVFRFVHDFFGHGKLGNSFGAIGEENAWNVHSKMYSPEARKAMTTETRGQNSWVNFGPHMRNKDGGILKKGEEGYKDAKSRPFAEQKIGLLPDWAMESLEGQSFSFDEESPAGKKLKEFVDKKLTEGVDPAKLKKYIKEKTGLSDKVINEIFEKKSEKKEEKPKEKSIEEKVAEIKPKDVARTVPVEQSAEINGKVVDLTRIPVSDRAKTVLGRVFNNPETPQTLIDALTQRFGSREEMLKSKRYSQVEARELGAEIVKQFDNLKDAVDFARNPGVKIDGDIQAAIIDNVIAQAYNLEKKSKTQEDREYYQNIQGDALDEIAKIGEDSGRRISYYNMMYNMNPVIFGEKIAEKIDDLNAAILDKKIGDTAKNADEKISEFARESKQLIDTEQKKAATSKKVTDIIEGSKKPKYSVPKTNKSQKEIASIREKRKGLMDKVKGFFKKDPGSNQSFSFDEASSFDEARLGAIKEVGDTFIDEGYVNYNSWARKVQNEFKEAGITIYGKELQEAWGQLNEKVQATIKETYKKASPEEVKSLIESQAAGKVKELNQAIKDILADSQVSPDMKDKIKGRLISELGLSEGYSSEIVDAFSQEFEVQARKQVESKLKAIKNQSFVSSFKKPNQKAEAKIVNDVLNGTFDGADLKPAFYDMYGISGTENKTELKEKLINLSRRVANQREGSLMKDKAMRELYNEIQRHKPTSSFQLGTDVYYASMLSGYETHIKNFAMFNAMQVYLNKPLQMAMQNVISGNKSKSAKAIYSKELANFMLNEAKGIVLTGDNPFYDKPHSQSEVEKFVKDGKSGLFRKLWRYAHLPTRFLSAEDAFGTVGLSDVRARQLMYDKIKSELKNKGAEIIPEQINQEVEKALGYTIENVASARTNAEQSLKNYYGDDFNLQEELMKQPKNKEEKLRKEKIKSEYNRETYREIIKSRDQEVQANAMQWAKTSLLQNDPEGTMGRLYLGLNSMIQHIPALRLFIPFLKVPLNVTNNLIQSTPGSSYVRLITGRKGTFGGQKLSKREYNEHLQRAATYTFLMAGLAALQGLEDEDGNPFFYVTGKNGKSFTEASAREVAGIDQPYTVYVGGEPILKYQYTPWMPLFAGLGIYNDLRLENGGEIPENMETSEKAANVFIRYANTINEQAALKGMNEIFNLVQEGYDEFSKGNGNWALKLKEFAGKKAASVAKTLAIPNAATQANTDIKALFDADRIATTSYMDDIIKDMPIVDIVSQQYFGNESKIDVLGRPIKEKFSVAGYGKVGDDQFYKMFVDKNYLPYAYNKRKIKVRAENDNGDIVVEEKPLDLEERYNANLKRGTMLREYMTENFEDLQEMSQEDFKKTIQSKIKAFDKDVETELFGGEDSQ